MMTHAFPATTLRRRALLLALAATPAATLAQPKGEILVGRSTALSGGMAPFMAPVHEGQDAAIADLNAQGGIGGRPVRLVTLDDGFDAKRALDNARTLSEKDGVVALFGMPGTSQVMTLLPYLAQAKLPLIGVYTGSPTVRMQGSPYLFTTSASYTDELVKIVRNLVSIESSRIAVVYESNDFGKLLLPLAEKVIAAEKATLVGSQVMDSTGKDAEAAAKVAARRRKRDAPLARWSVPQRISAASSPPRRSAPSLPPYAQPQRAIRQSVVPHTQILPVSSFALARPIRSTRQRRSNNAYERALL